MPIERKEVVSGPQDNHIKNPGYIGNIAFLISYDLGLFLKTQLSSPYASNDNAYCSDFEKRLRSFP